MSLLAHSLLFSFFIFCISRRGTRENTRGHSDGAFVRFRRLHHRLNAIKLQHIRIQGSNCSSVAMHIAHTRDTRAQPYARRSRNELNRALFRPRKFIVLHFEGLDFSKCDLEFGMHSNFEFRMSWQCFSQIPPKTTVRQPFVCQEYCRRNRGISDSQSAHRTD